MDVVGEPQKLLLNLELWKVVTKMNTAAHRIKLLFHKIPRIFLLIVLLPVVVT